MWASSRWKPKPAAPMSDDIALGDFVVAQDRELGLRVGLRGRAQREQEQREHGQDR